MLDENITADSSSMHCPRCDGRAGARFEIDQFDYGAGEDAVELQARVVVFRCDACDYDFMDASADDARHRSVCDHLGLLAPDDIKSIRKAYGLSRVDFAAITRLGEATVGRWERGELLQNAAYDNYLRLLSDEHNFSFVRDRDRRESVSTQRVASGGVGQIVELRAFKDSPDRLESSLRRQKTFQL